MSEKKFELKAFGVDYVCDKCGDGLMEQTGIFLPVDPPLWKHKCSKCGHEQNMHDKYPAVRYVRVAIVASEVHG